MTLGLETTENSERKVVQTRLAPPGVEYYVASAPPLMEIKVLGPVNAGHVADLELTRPVVPLVDALRARYHEIARLTAAGIDNIEISRRLNITVEQIEMLQEVPSFKMVLQQHTTARDKAFNNLRGQINMVAEDALARAHAMVLDGTLDGKHLVALLTKLLEMDGYGAVQKHLVAVASSDEIARAKRAALEANADRVLPNISSSNSSNLSRGNFLPVSKD